MTEHYTDNRRWSYISNAWILLDSWNDSEEIESLRAARSADESLMREAAEALETCVWIGGEQLFNRPRVADAKSALRARLEGTTS